MAGKRSIFEEVQTATGPVERKTGLIASGTGGNRRGIRLWLVGLFLLIVVMIALGGWTRLTDSGLSITEWKPVVGIMPPLSAEDWATAFTRYQATPEFQLQNSAMTLDRFKDIFWPEWAHRFLGRAIGLVWAIGFAGFYLARRIPAGWTGRLFVLGPLIAGQGLIGWLMVRSGLRDGNVDVESYWLAAHLGLAFVILGLVAWAVFSLQRTQSGLLQARRSAEPRLAAMATGLMHFAFLQILLGALVAGIDAGRAYPTWPDMNGQFFPADAFYVPGRPVWAAFFENAGLVQFLHRMSGYLLFAFGIVVWLRGRKSVHAATRGAFHMVLTMLVAQVALGIAAVLTSAHVHVALTHQIGAIILWVLILRAGFQARYPLVGSIREGTA